jgi:transcription factor SOX7/8/10/18 (SOX group E/F)
MFAGQSEEVDNARRPPNAFILYSQAMRTAVRQEHPALSNTEVSAVLGKMWKEVPTDQKLIYKQKAAAAQEIFKQEHPDYTYRKARRKRTLNELLTKSSQGFPMPDYPPTDISNMNPYAFMGMYQQMQNAIQQPGMPFMQTPAPGQAQIPRTGAPQSLPATQMTGYPNMHPFQGIGDQAPGMASTFYQFHQK